MANQPTKATTSNAQPTSTHHTSIGSSSSFTILVMVYRCCGCKELELTAATTEKPNVITKILVETKQVTNSQPLNNNQAKLTAIGRNRRATSRGTDTCGSINLFRSRRREVRGVKGVCRYYDCDGCGDRHDLALPAGGGVEESLLWIGLMISEGGLL